MRIKYWALAFVCCAALLGCKAEIDRNILLVGDSLLRRTAADIQQELLMADDHGYFPMNNGIDGSTFSFPDMGGTYLVQRAPTQLAQHTVDTVIISLGTNDVYQEVNTGRRLPAGDIALAAAQVLDAYPDRPVVWILPHANVGSVWPQGVYLKVCAAIRTAAASRPDVQVVDFTAYATAHGYTLDQLTGADRIHFNPTGATLWAQFIHQLAQ